MYVDSNKYIIVGVCYRSQEADVSELDQLFESIKLAADAHQPVLIMGDFNYPDINWSMLTADSTGHDFLKLTLDCYLEQHVQQPLSLIHI